MNFTNTQKLAVIGNVCIGSNIAGAPHIYVIDCPGSFFAENSFSNGDKTGARIGLQVFGDATGIKLGRSYQDSNISAINPVPVPTSSTSMGGEGKMAVSARFHASSCSDVCRPWPG